MGYTKGPWNNYAGDDIYCVYDAAGKKICSIEPVDIVGWNAVHREEADANESLIKAAPDMFEAIDDLLMLADDSMLVEWFGREFVDKARAAYARAKGEAE